MTQNGKNQKQKPLEYYNKENFLNKLAEMTPEDINNIIKEKGKRPKLINPIYFIRK